jgi:type VI secretion system protein ImpF
LARSDSQNPLLPSLLDRLIDTDPLTTTEPAWRQSQSLREYETSVLRDLEQLLNNRQPRPDMAQDEGELRRSVYTYGMPEFSSTGVGSAQDREVLRRAVEETISAFEPRLRDVRVTLHQPTDNFDRTLRLTVDGLLWLDPTPMPVTFDTLVQPASGQCVVKPRSI